jgi:phosphate:Na+ symporter
MSVLFSQTVIFGLFGGLGLFLFGMKIMSEGLQKVAGDRKRQIQAAHTNNRIIGTQVGLGVTAIIQSSSATTVMVVGFVNAGLMSLVQAIGVVLGANIGTTVTAQIIAFKITKFALPAIGLGTGLKLFSRSKRWMYIGEVILGFGILFFGMQIMKDCSWAIGCFAAAQLPNYLNLRAHFGFWRSRGEKVAGKAFVVIVY